MSSFQTLSPADVERLLADTGSWMTVRDVEDRAPVDVQVVQVPDGLPVVELDEVAS